MINRIDYSKVNPKAIQTLGAINKHVSSIDEKLRAIVELRVSQINGCAYCLDLHSNQAREAGVFQQKLDCLSAWNESSLFTDRECAALDWAEAVTRVGDTHVPDDKYETLRKYFSDEQIVDLTLIIVLINSWNRLSVSFRRLPTPQ